MSYSGLSYTGAAEADYEWSGSRANPGLLTEQAPKDAATGGIWGMPPQKIVEF